MILKIFIRAIVTFFVITALFYGTVKLEYIELTPKGRTAFKTVFADSIALVKSSVAGLFRGIADKVESQP